MMIDDLKTLHVEYDDAVVKVRLNRPETGSAVSGPLLDELLAVLGTLDDHPTPRVLVLSGEGADFCRGGGMAEYETGRPAAGNCSSPPRSSTPPKPPSRPFCTESYRRTSSTQPSTAGSNRCSTALSRPCAPRRPC
ncbi:enoyl-CoA hydratase-related protein [Streptomyces sp. NPDC093109]|uniref:enoyl-CoA hydratase-related protein n=1 Tax=Streptomyces sp. NPDC093109 TaxID=3154977 RepID=UPI003450C6DD